MVHDNCLMTVHIHVLATLEKSSSISNTMKVVGSRHALYMNPLTTASQLEIAFSIS